jgi:hypothetical protein
MSIEQDRKDAPSGDAAPEQRTGEEPAAARERDAAHNAAQELLDLRAASHAYHSLIRNMLWSFRTKGLTVRVAGRKGGQPEPIGGETPTLTAVSKSTLFILEFATAEMLRNAHLLARLRTFAALPEARRWLVVPAEDWAYARKIVAEAGVEWQVVAGDR